MIVIVLVQLLVVVTMLLAAGAALFIGRDRLRETRYEYHHRLTSVAPYAGLLGVVLVANKVARDIGPDISWVIGWNITPYLHKLDGILLSPFYRGQTPQVVVWLQSMATPELTAYFTFIYVYGYVFLLVFPVVAYFALPDSRPLRRTIVAYGANYVIGVTCYILFIAYGPRNVISMSVDGLMYTHHSQYQFLTTAINTDTNVFPSLHTSMAITAVILAWTTHDEYPRWTPVAAVIGGSVVVATMYLGIHWATDAIFGVVLGVLSVKIGRYMEERPPEFVRLKRWSRSLRNAIGVRAR
jgi:membrane-associated phospholipid phosphatase